MRNGNLGPHFRRFGWMIVLIVLAGFLFYRWRFAAIEVETHHVKRGILRAEVFGTGTLEAKTHAVLGAQISGRIAEMTVEQGERVTSGQLLARLDSDELQRQLEMAQATLEVAKAGVHRLEADHERAKAVQEQAQRDFVRAKSLLESKVQSASESEKSQEKLAVAEADLNRTLGAIAEAEAQVLAAEKTLLYHQARLNYTAIKAPFDGLVLMRHCDPGDIIVPGSSICEIVATDVLWISAWVDETQMDVLKPGQPARIVFRSNPETPFVGTIDRLGRQVDRETREFVVDVRVLDLPTNWAIGQRAEVYIETDRREHVLMLPLRFLGSMDGVPGVWDVRKGAVYWQSITTGLRGNDMVEIVDGLSEGESIVAIPRGGEPGLRDGRKVEVK